MTFTGNSCCPLYSVCFSLFCSVRICLSLVQKQVNYLSVLIFNLYWHEEVGAQVFPKLQHKLKLYWQGMATWFVEPSCHEAEWVNMSH